MDRLPGPVRPDHVALADLDAGEITDRGYVNQRRVLTHRAAPVGLLYAEQPVRGVIVAEGTP